MSMGNLGGASFNITANTLSFERGMASAQASAKRTAQIITKDVGAMSASLTRKMNEIDRAVDEMNAKVGTLGKQSKMGLGLLAIGNMVDDLQYGFRSVVNNIPQVVLMMTGNAGLAGASAIAAVAVNQLATHWDKLADSMKSGWLNVPAEALERVRIRAEKANEAFEKLMQEPSKFEAKQINALTEVITGADKGGAAMVVKGVRNAVEMDKGLRAKMEPGDAVEVAKRVAMKAFENAVNFKDVVGLEELKRRVIAEMLKEKNEAMTKRILGSALRPGEEGVWGRNTLQRIIAEHPDMFSEKFRKAMGGTTDEAVEHSEANRRAAGMLMKGPLGRRMLMGEGLEDKGPTKVTEEQGLAMVKANSLLRRMNPQVRKEMAKRLAGHTDDLVEMAMKGMTPAAIEEHARKNFRNKETGAVNMAAGAMDFLIRRIEAAKDAGPGPRKVSPFERDLGGKLKGAGIEGDARGVLKEMREMNKERLQNIMMEKGVNKEQAQRLLLQEQMRGLGGRSGNQYMSLQQFAHMSSGEVQMPDIARQQLKELTEIRKFMAKDDQRRQMMTGVAGGAAAGGLLAALAGNPG